MSIIRECNLVRLAPLLAIDALELQQIARSLHRLDEAACNRELTQREDTRLDRLTGQAAALALRHGLNIYRQHDPRGWPLFLFDPNKVDISSINSTYPDVAIGVCPH
jgi:hypothetical protein